MKAQDYKISSEKFVFRTTDGNLHDNKLETKPVSYFRDALNRFAKNKASILAFFIIIVLVLFALIAPILSPFTVADEDMNYALVVPKNQWFYDMGIHFWDGGKEVELNKIDYDIYRAIEQEIGRKVIMTEPEIVEREYFGKMQTLYSFRLDTYNAVGVKFMLLTDAEYTALQAYQDATQATASKPQQPLPTSHPQAPPA